MKIIVNAGHTLNGKGTGAVGYITESVETRKVAKHLISILKEKGHNAIEVNVDKSTSQAAYLREVVNKSNANKGVDLFVSIHFNAGKGRGTECYTWKGRKYKIATDICRNLNKLGFVNRGVKDGSDFYVVRNTTMEAMLIEVCFVDTFDDVALYKKHGAKAIAEAIANGIEVGNEKEGKS